MSVENIDFSQLDLRDALDLAILIEEEAAERYRELARQMELHHTTEAAGFFRKMISNEEKHGTDLTIRRGALFQDAPRKVTRAMLWDVEAPEYDEVRPLMTVREALEVALRAEKKAQAFFAAALPHMRDGEAKDLFEELRDEEVEHQKMVEEQLAKLPPDSGVNPADYEDEPVAQ